MARNFPCLSNGDGSDVAAVTPLLDRFVLAWYTPKDMWMSMFGFGLEAPAFMYGESSRSIYYLHTARAPQRGVLSSYY